MSNYAAAWTNLLTRVRNGESWSGHERNVCYLNTGSNGFADVSAVSGLDQPGDGRALASIDWNRDGAIDLIYRNRTAPRVQLMLNQSPTKDRGWLELQLVGTSCNRDAIGAVVEVTTAEESTRRFVRSVRAGDLFLSQSSKRLHFGLGKRTDIRAVRVLWPGTRESESFTGVLAGHRYLLRQGTGKATQIESVDSIRFPAIKRMESRSGPPRSGRVVMPARIPLPEMGYKDFSGAKKRFSGSKPGLLLLWSAQCAHCPAELLRWKDFTRDLPTALCIDANDENAREEVFRIVRKSRFPGTAGFLDAKSLQKWDAVQEALFDRRPVISTPCYAFVEGGAILAIYRDPPSDSELRNDIEQLRGADHTDLHRLAPPYAGRWLNRAVSDAQVSEFLARRLQKRFPDQSLVYLHEAATHSTGEKQEALHRELALRHHKRARDLEDRHLPDEAEAYYRQALVYAPESAGIHHDLAIMLASHGKLDEAEALLRRTLQIAPDHDMARRNLKRVRALIQQTQ